MLNLKQLWRKLLLSLVFAALVFLLLSFYANFQELSEALLDFPVMLLPVLLLLSFCNYIIRFLKWDFYLRILNISVTRSQSFSIFLAGLIMSISPGKFGEVLKSFLLKSVNGTPISRSAPIVVAERFTDFIGLIVLVLLGLSSSQSNISVLMTSIGLVIAFTVIIGSQRLSLKIINMIGSVIHFFFPPPITDNSGTRQLSLRMRLGAVMEQAPQKMVVAYESISTMVTIRRLIWTSFLSVISWTFEGVAFLLLLYGFGFSLPVTECLFIYAFSIIIGALTMLPGGVGLTETSLSGLLILKSVPKAVAVAVTLIIRITTLWFAVGLGALMLVYFLKKNPIQKENTDIHHSNSAG